MLERNSCLNVALFTDTFDEVNGVARTYQTMLKNAVEKGRRLDIYTYGSLEQKEDVEDWSEQSARILRFKPKHAVRYYEKLRFELFQNPLIRERFSEMPYGLVQIAAPGSMGYMGRKLAREFKVPCVGAYHTKLDEYVAERVPRPFGTLTRGVVRSVLKKFYGQCDVVLATTPKMQEWLRSSRFAARTEIFSRGVDINFFRPRNRPRRRKRNSPIALYVGRICKEKNLKLIKDAYRRWEGKVIFKFVGDGPYREELQRALPKAVFTGYLHGEALADAYAEADLFLFPSVTDTFGNVVQEAMACGVPPLVRDQHGPGELVEDGADGWIAQSDEHFVDLCGRLLESPTVLASAGVKARERAVSCSWDAVFDQLWSVYDKTTKV